MPSPNNHRKGGHEKNKRGRLSEKASSFHGRGDVVAEMMLPRPRTVPDLLSGKKVGGNTADEMAAQGRPPRLTKLLLNVNIQRSLGPVQVLISPESTVEDLIAAALRQYSKEVRRPILSTEASGFNLHYSQFSLQSLDRNEKLLELGSRNFFLCPKTTVATTTTTTTTIITTESGGAVVTTSNSRCSKEADIVVTKKGLPWLKFMNF